MDSPHGTDANTKTSPENHGTANAEREKFGWLNKRIAYTEAATTGSYSGLLADWPSTSTLILV